MARSVQKRPKKDRDMNQSAHEESSDLVLKAFDTLFNHRDFSKAEQYWSTNYIQHSEHIPAGRFSGRSPGAPNWVVVDIVRLENGILAEHWDVIQDEATSHSSKSGQPMSGSRFPDVKAA
jgi:predicted SnoaL-like aldol condensation-catalyzing enzyme